jgi:hypothetical protein
MRRPERQQAKKALKAPIKPHRNHKTPPSMASASVANPYFEVPLSHAASFCSSSMA